MKHIDGWWCPDVLSGPGKFLRRADVIPYALLHWHGPRRHAFQAGAHIGVWPRMLAQYFDAVTCVEPAPANWGSLLMNIVGFPRIRCVHGLLGAQRALLAGLNVNPHSSGGHHAATRYDRDYVLVGQYTIDELVEGSPVDAVFLDIEGQEWAALHGAAETLARDRPLLVIEDNGCSRKYGIETGAVGRWLAQEFGYKQVWIHGEDVVFIAESATPP